MGIDNILNLVAGLALFLLGMNSMGSGLENACGNKMKIILEKLTANRFLGVIVGALITMVIQSSSATTVMVVGFVNAGMMTLSQAVWIIMGANIGTTITGQLIALDVGEIAPLIAFIGVAAIVFTKNVRAHHIGNILAGLGILFIGMNMMGESMKPLSENEAFVDILTKFENPVLGIFAGMIFTAIIQSSSASVGILQTLAVSGAIGFDSAVFVLFGQNIGTCITALLASIGTSRNARRTTVIHISFNIIGTIIFTTLCLLTPIVSIVEGFTPTDVSKQIANMHTIFNITTTLLLIPVGGYLAKFAELILKDTVDEEEDHITLKYIQNIKNINDEQFGVSAMSLDSAKKEIARMMEMAKNNVGLAFDTFKNYDSASVTEVSKKEEDIDFLYKEISRYISRVMTHQRTEAGSKVFNSLFTIASNIERISDHAMNVGGYSKLIKERGIKFSDIAMEEIDEIKVMCDELLSELFKDSKDVVAWHGKVAAMEQKVDDMTKEFRNNMFTRVRKGLCKDEGSIVFSEMLTDFERIGDHSLNIADEIMNIKLAGY